MDSLDTHFVNTFLSGPDIFSPFPNTLPMSSQHDIDIDTITPIPDECSPTHMQSHNPVIYSIKKMDTDDTCCRSLTVSENSCRALCVPRKRGRPPLDKTTRKCTNCGTNATPEWRKGPAGPHTLCNACGLHFMKAQRREKQTRVKHGLNRLLNTEAAEQKKLLALQSSMPSLDAQGQIISSQPQEPQAQVQAQVEAFAQAHEQLKAQEELNAAVMAQAQLHAHIQAQLQAQCQAQSSLQAFLNSSDDCIPSTIIPTEAPSCHSDFLQIPPEYRLQAAFASLSAALQLPPTTADLFQACGGAQF